MQWMNGSRYVEKFRTAFERKGMLLNRFHNIQHKETGFCLTSTLTEKMTLATCSQDKKSHRWQSVAGGRMLYNQESEGCIDLTAGPGIKPCKWDTLLKEGGTEQLWLFEQTKSNKIFNRKMKGYGSLTGNDIFVSSSLRLSPFVSPGIQNWPKIGIHSVSLRSL